MSSASIAPSEARSSTIVWAESTNPCVASSSARASTSASAVADLADGLARAQLVGDQVEDRLLRAAAPRQQVRQQQLGVELDDAHEQLVLAKRPHGTQGGADDPLDRPGLLAPASAAATTAPHSRVIRSPSSWPMSDHER